MPNEVKIHVKSEDHTDMDLIGRKVTAKAKTSFLKTGAHSGAAFLAGFLKTITLGQVGSGFAMAATKMAPQMAHIGGALGVTLAGALAVKLASSLSALLPLALGGAILAGPIIYLISKQVKGIEALKKNKQQMAALDDRLLAKDKQINAIADRVLHSKGKAKETAEKQLEIQKQSRREMEGEWATLKKQQQALEQMTFHLRDLKKHAKSFMETLSWPVIVPLNKSMGLISRRLDEWGPKIRKAIGPLAKELPGFVKGLLGGLENFGKEIGKKMPSITKGFKEWGKQLPGIGKAIGKMLAAWIEDGPAVAKGVQDLAGSLKDLLGTVGAVGRGFRRFNKINDGFKNMIDEQRATILKWRIAVLKGLISVADAWGKISPEGRKVAASLRKSLSTARHDFEKTTNAINRRKIEPKIKADISNLQDRIRDAKRRLKETHNQKTKPKIQAEINQLRAQVAAAKRALASIHDKKVRIIVTRTNAPGYGIKGPGVATGGFIGGRSASHAAEGGPRGGQTWVGEHGPELVDLPLGSHVNSNPDSMQQMAKGGRGGGPHLHFHFDRYTGSTTDLVRDLVNAKKRGQLDVLFR